MVVVYSFAGFVGAALTAFGLWQAGPLVALAAMPLGGSVSAAGVAALLTFRSEHSTAYQRLPDGVVWC
jgi:hypothetical protein